MRHVIQLQTRAQGVGDRGQVTGSWTNAEQVLGSIRTLKGREIEQAQKKWELAEKEIILYPSASLTGSTVRVLYEGRIFQVGHVEDVDEFGTMKRLLVSEQING